MGAYISEDKKKKNLITYNKKPKKMTLKIKVTAIT